MDDWMARESGMINIDVSEMIGKGYHRECYVHPDNPAWCIKIVVSGGPKETQREQTYYRLLKKKNISWDMLARFHGNVDTNLGSGAVFDLIRDHDGSVSRTFGQYLEAGASNDPILPGLSQALSQLRQYLVDWKIVTMTLKPKNIVFQKRNDTEGKLVIIDNIGNSEFIPFSSYIGYFGLKKVERRWDRFEQFMLNLYPDNEILPEMIKACS